MRNIFVKTLSEIARQDPNLILMTGDLGFGILDDFEKEFPRQYINAGVAEQNMTGMAVGLALEGKTVYTYSICNFPTLRCLEQIRNDACYHRANVKIVSIGSGLSYGAQGMSHFSTEDLAVMRALPYMQVLSPGDPIETASATRAIHQSPGPAYLRIGRGAEPNIHDPAQKLNFKLGQAIPILEGQAVVIFAIGSILKNAHTAALQLRQGGKDVGLYSIPTLKPLDEALIRQKARDARLILTVEEHTVMGGLGSAVAEVLAQMSAPRAELQMLGIRDFYPSLVGDQEYLRGICGLSVESIMKVATPAH